jgi:pimeloyl-ACP methyl ester carboxylesterase
MGTSANPTIDIFLRFLRGNDLLLKLSWDEYMMVGVPFPKSKYSIQDVAIRYSRNSYDWDIHGTLYTPEKETIPGKAILLVHGGGVNESTFNKAPHGWAPILASQGFKVLTVSYPGLWPPKGVWPKDAEERTPIFIFDKEISPEELKDRILKYTFNLVVQGIAMLMDQNLFGSDILAFGHSIGARLVVDLWRFTKKTRITGIMGFGSLGPKVWEDELQEMEYKRTGSERPKEERPSFENLTRFRTFLRETHEPRIFLPILRTYTELEECVKLSGLPKEEYFDNTLTKDPDKRWLKNIKVLLLVGENDNTSTSHNWPKERPLKFRPAYYIAKKFSYTTRGTHLVIIPRFGHIGHLEPHSEKIIYLWLWAIKSGYFE